MIQLKTTTAKTIAPGQSITFDETTLHTGCGECFNKSVPTSVKLCGRCATYEIHFNGNVSAGTAGAALQMALAVDGSPMTDTNMNTSPAAANTLENISTSKLLQTCRCGDLGRVSVVNTGANALNLAAGANLYIVRKS